MKNDKTDLPILAIETSGDLCGVALLKKENVFYEINANEKNIHSEILFKLIDDALSKANVKPNELKAIAVSNGPGSFTGLRIGAAAAKGLATGAKLPVVAVPTFEALAFQIANYMPANIKFIIANKANSTEVYYAKYLTMENNSFTEIEKLQMIHAEEIEEKRKDADKIFGNYLSKTAVNNSSPRAIFISLWAYYFGKDLVTFNFDLIEPNYFKNLNIKQGVSR